MAHEITIRDDGFAEAVFAMEPAWHGLGKVMDHPMTSREALTEAGLDWLVVQEPVFRREIAADQTFRYSQVSSHWLNVRSDSGKILGMVTRRYKVVQNIEAFEFLDALVEGHEMLYETAFSLRGGKRVVLLARLPGVDTVVNGDHLLRYVLLSLSHDGTQSIRVRPTSVRVVCANTLALALREDQQEVCIRHVGDISYKLEAVRKVLADSNVQFGQYLEASRRLASRRLDRKDWQTFLRTLFPIGEKDSRSLAKVMETREEITSRFYNERQSLAEESAWSAYCAVVEWVDHRPRRGKTWLEKSEARFVDALYGAGHLLKNRAFQLACQMTGVSV